MVKGISNTGTVWVAIDVAKRSHQVVVETPQGRTRRFRVQQNRKDYEAFSGYLQKLGGEVVIGLELTGDYHRTLAHYLLRQGFQIHLLSSVAASQVREAVFNSWDKNDPKDADVLLQMLQQGLTQIYYDPLQQRFHDIQELSKTYRQVTLARSRLLHSLCNHYLPLCFPEAEKYLHTTRARWFAETFLRFPTPSAIVRYDLETFIEQAWEVVGRKVFKRQWLCDLYRTAEESVALPLKEDSLAVETYRMVLRQYRDVNRLRQDIEQRAQQHRGDDPDYRRLQTLPGVGPVIALIILAEAGDLRRFAHHRKFLKFCGLNLATYQSGKSRGQTRLSKRGNAELRCAFWTAATVAIRGRENSFRHSYENLIRKDSQNADVKRKAYTAVAAKMARVAYTLIKSDTDYRCYPEAARPSGKIPFVRAVGAEMTP